MSWSFGAHCFRFWVRLHTRTRTLIKPSLKKRKQTLAVVTECIDSLNDKVLTKFLKYLVF